MFGACSIPGSWQQRTSRLSGTARPYNSVPELGIVEYQPFVWPLEAVELLWNAGGTGFALLWAEDRFHVVWTVD